MRDSGGLGLRPGLTDTTKDLHVSEKIIIAVVVIVSLAAHYWLYRWVKFKIDEGVILKCLEDAKTAADPAQLSSQAIAGQTQMKLQRVALICQQSPKIQPAPDAADTWLIIQDTGTRL